jgi:hypothetical protein
VIGPLIWLALGCGTQSDSEVEPASADPWEELERLDFNRVAAEHHLPVFWRSDDDGRLAPEELAILIGGRDAREDYIVEGAFTEGFADTLQTLIARSEGWSGTDVRVKDVLEELGQARPTLIETSVAEEEQAFVDILLQVAEVIEEIHAIQLGSAGLQPGPDLPSQALFARNQSPWCTQPLTRDRDTCSASPDLPPRISGLYPASIQKDEAFCEILQARPDAEQLMAPFVVVRQGANGDLTAVPYPQAYSAQMSLISLQLKGAAALLPEEEGAFAAYLTALSDSFQTNDWQPADEAWASMNAKNSAWYLRLGPDETYFEPCNRHAGFHMSFARINQDSMRWQRKLEPVKADMERAVAALSGAPYTAREVSFHLPDFIDIILNAGDSRSPAGATIGQSLPNWGPVANEGRGRTVAMTNIGTDADSVAASKETAASLLCDATMTDWTPDPQPLLVSTVLHEAAHNLGPSHEYQVDGLTADEAFGGPLASTMEELKAQTAALYLSTWLAEKGVIEADLAKQAHVKDLTWAFSKIASGMYEDGYPKAYSQLSAIQVGMLMDDGAVVWQPDTMAANGQDTGCFDVVWPKFDAGVERMARDVFGAKARNDKAAATAWVARFVDGREAPSTRRFDVIAQRTLRTPKPAYVYAIRSK